MTYKEKNKFNQWAIISLIFMTIAVLTISTYCFFSGWFIVHQNLFYIPIVISCMFFDKKGFAFSVVLSFIYLFLIISFKRDSTVIIEALIRVFTFVGVAGVITFLSIMRKRNEEKLRAVSIYTRNLIEASLDPLITISRDGKIMDVNRATEHLTGLSREQLIGTDFSNYFTEPQKAKEGYQKVLSEGQVKDYPLTIRYHDGRLIDVLYNATVYRNEKGDLQGVFAAARDITEIKKAEDVSNLLAAIVDGSNDAILSKNLEGHILSWNKAAEDMYGYEAKEIIGRHILLLYPPGGEDAHDRIMEQIKHGEKVSHFETERVRKDGSRVWVSLSVSPTWDSRGTINGASIIARDITERKEIEAGLEKTRKELAVIKRSADEASEFAESVINTVREPLIALDQDLRVVKVSRSFYKFFEVKPEDTVGQLIYDLGNKQWDIPKLRELLETILPQKTTFDNYEVEHNFTTIGRRIMLLNARQIERGAGKERIILLAIEDITERKEIEAGLEKTRKELDTFSYSVSHDLKAPLRAMAGFSNILSEDYAPKLDDNGRRLIGVINDNVGKMGQLIEDLLKLSHQGRQAMDVVDIDMTTLVQSVYHELREELFCDRAIEVSVKPLPAARADYTLAKQIFTNLISNAMKFTSRKDKALIEIGGYDKGQDRVYYVKDNGAGFDMKYEDKLFGVFQRLHGQDEFSGTGIGLAIVSNAVRRHGGKVWAEGQVDKGATFYFTIPKNLKNRKKPGEILIEEKKITEISGNLCKDVKDAK
jgi:PAS domain S-box-containing protein